MLIVNYTFQSQDCNLKMILYKIPIGQRIPFSDVKSLTPLTDLNKVIKHFGIFYDFDVEGA